MPASPYDSILGPEPESHSPLDVLEGIGQGINPGYGQNPNIPGPAAFGGQLLKSFGESRASQRSLSRSRALESKLGVPVDFFLRLSKEAQKDTLERAGVGGQSYLDIPQPELEGQTWRKASSEGLTNIHGQHSIPLDLIPKEQAGAHLAKLFPGLGSTTSDLDKARTDRLEGQESRDAGKYPVEVSKLLEEIDRARASGDASRMLTALRAFKLNEGKALSEANPVPESVLEAARHQGFSQFAPGTQIAWKEFRAITKNNAAMNAYADALTRTVARLSQLAQSGQKIDESSVNQVADQVAKSLKGYISEASIRTLRQAIKDQWRTQAGMVTGGVQPASPLPYEDGSPMGDEEDSGLGGDPTYP